MPFFGLSNSTLSKNATTHGTSSAPAAVVRGFETRGRASADHELDADVELTATEPARAPSPRYHRGQ